MDRWDRDHLAELVKVDGQVLTIDMDQVESIDVQIPRDVHEYEAIKPGDAIDGTVMVRKLGAMTTVVFVARVRAEGVKWR